MNTKKRSLETIRLKHGLSLVLLHGSYVTEKLHPQSDVDVAVVRRNKTAELDLLELINDLKHVFTTDKIDVADITHADPLLLYAVVSKSRLLAGSKTDYRDRERYAFHRYNDYLPFLALEKQFVKEKLSRYVTA